MVCGLFIQYPKDLGSWPGQAPGTPRAGKAIGLDKGFLVAAAEFGIVVGGIGVLLLLVEIVRVVGNMM